MSEALFVIGALTSLGCGWNVMAAPNRDWKIELVWSNEHRAWWRPQSAGYTIHLETAGQYSRSEAVAIAKSAHDGWRPGTPPPEIAVPLADAAHCYQQLETVDG